MGHGKIRDFVMKIKMLIQFGLRENFFSLTFNTRRADETEHIFSRICLNQVKR